MLYIGGFLMGGILESMRQYVRVGSLFLALAIAGYYIVLAIWKFISYVQRWNRYHCKVELQMGDKKCSVRGLIDTGNGLCDPISGQPVSILDRESARKLLGDETLKSIRYIPYQSIGKKNGVLPAFQIDKMCVYGEMECQVDCPLIGIGEEEFKGKGEYEMILNTNLF
jgi:stage II sporulation protein GA (sporulation sigma-E factor processing peptidase)